MSIEKQSQDLRAGRMTIILHGGGNLQRLDGKQESRT
jgi:hypothetical protein